LWRSCAWQEVREPALVERADNSLQGECADGSPFENSCDCLGIALAVDG
jgi:hypothetical protein